MCGRLTVVECEEIAQALNEMDYQAFLPIYNAPPSSMIPVSRDLQSIEMFKWGLVHSSSKDAKFCPSNARSDALYKTWPFKTLYKRNRCLVWADGLYEWDHKVSPSQPYRVQLQHRKCFTMAGLWDTWKAPNGNILNSFTIITTEPNELMAPLHHRMPVIIPPHLRADWLTPEAEYKDLEPFFSSFPSEQMIAYPVSRAVGSVQNKGAELIEPLQ